MSSCESESTDKGSEDSSNKVDTAKIRYELYRFYANAFENPDQNNF